MNPPSHCEYEPLARALAELLAGWWRQTNTNAALRTSQDHRAANRNYRKYHDQIGTT
jgi:hypothetical protein